MTRPYGYGGDWGISACLGPTGTVDELHSAPGDTKWALQAGLRLYATAKLHYTNFLCRGWLGHSQYPFLSVQGSTLCLHPWQEANKSLVNLSDMSCSSVLTSRLPKFFFLNMFNSEVTVFCASLVFAWFCPCFLVPACSWFWRSYAFYVC